MCVVGRSCLECHALMVGLTARTCRWREEEEGLGCVYGTGLGSRAAKGLELGLSRLGDGAGVENAKW